MTFWEFFALALSTAGVFALVLLLTTWLGTRFLDLIDRARMRRRKERHQYEQR
ncbi:MAG: hypothetical protein HYZ81_07925 [Nitrospinae bacterium]|nr:hypothetical protein [Nitrospinota bacterium]